MNEDRAKPLSHLRILDLSRVLAGPWASQLLADLGAEVIKVERPGAGDDTRAWGPPFLRDVNGQNTRQGGYFLAANRGKRSLTLDLAKPEGQDIVRRLAAECDVLFENYKVGTLDRFGLGPSHLATVNPRLVYCSVTGFGQSGPRAAEPAYDFLIQAMGGLMSLTGDPDGAPQKVGVPIVDMVTGVYAAVGVLAALLARERTGKGDYVDVAMLDVQVGMLCNQAMNYLVGGRTPKRAGNAHPNIQPQQVFSASDADFVIVVGNDTQFSGLCQVLGQPALAQDARFADNGSRVVNKPVLTPILEAAFAKRERSHWMDALARAGVPCGPINTVPEVFAEPQVQHRQMLHRVPHPVAGEVALVASPLRLGGLQAMAPGVPPALGADTEAVLAEIGVTPAQLQALRERGIV